MTRCCDWQPDPTVFGPCPHCTKLAPKRTVAEMFTILREVD